MRDYNDIAGSMLSHVELLSKDIDDAITLLRAVADEDEGNCETDEKMEASERLDALEDAQLHLTALKDGLEMVM